MENCVLDNSNDPAALRAEVDELKRQVADVQRRLEAVERQTRGPDKPAKLETERAIGVLHARMVTPAIAVTAPDLDSKIALLYIDVLEQLHAINPIEPPSDFEKMIDPVVAHRRYQYQALYLIGYHGLNPQQEIDFLCSTACGNKPRAARRAIERLAETGLLIRETILLFLTRSTKVPITLLRLSDTGRALCRVLGWEPIEDEWSRVLRLHQGQKDEHEHTAAILMTAMHARQRGYRPGVVPDLKGVSSSRPDLLLENPALSGVEGDGERVYVEVELSDKELPAKWRNLVDLQGFVGLVARNETYRKRLVGDCHLKGYSVLATDLVTLNKMPFGKRTPQTSLWIREKQTPIP